MTVSGTLVGRWDVRRAEVRELDAGQRHRERGERGGQQAVALAEAAAHEAEAAARALDRDVDLRRPDRRRREVVHGERPGRAGGIGDSGRQGPEHDGSHEPAVGPALDPPTLVHRRRVPARRELVHGRVGLEGARHGGKVPPRAPAGDAEPPLRTGRRAPTRPRAGLLTARPTEIFCMHFRWSRSGRCEVSTVPEITSNRASAVRYRARRPADNRRSSNGSRSMMVREPTAQNVQLRWELRTKPCRWAVSSPWFWLNPSITMHATRAF